MCKREGKRGERGGEGREQRRRARSPPSANARSLGESPSANAAEPIEKNLPARSAIAEWKMRAQGGEGGGEGAEANPAGSYACMSCFSLDPPFLHLSLSHPSPIAFSLAPLLYPPPTTEKGRQRSAPRARGGVLRQVGGQCLACVAVRPAELHGVSAAVLRRRPASSPRRRLICCQTA